MSRSILVAVACFVVAAYLQGCGIDCKADSNCKSPDASGGTDCCVCERALECMTCAQGFYAKATGDTEDSCEVRGTDYGQAKQYECKQDTVGDMTACTSLNGAGGTDCIVAGVEAMSCSGGKTGQLIADATVPACTMLADSKYYTCV